MKDDEFKLTQKDKQYLMYGLALICLLVIIIGTYKLIQDIPKAKQCKDKDGFYMKDKSCYIPRDEIERQQIIEQGYVKTGFDIDDLVMNWSLE